MAAASRYVSEATGQGDDSLQTVAPKAPITYQHVVTTSSNGIPSPSTFIKYFRFPLQGNPAAILL